MPRSAEDIFHLLDTRGVGHVTLESVFAFTEGFRRVVSLEQAARIFKEADVDGSGDIELGEFSKLLRGLEHVSRMSVEEMVERFVERQYHVLFDLVDEDGGGTLSRDEVKPLLESVVQVLGLKAMCDVGIVFRSVGVGQNDDINFPQFRALLTRLVGPNKPISHLVESFREVKAKKKAAADRSKRLAETTVRALGGTIRGSCTQCQAKEATIRHLEDKLRHVHDDGHRTSTRSVSEAPSRDDDREDYQRRIAEHIQIRDSSICASEEDMGSQGVLHRMLLQSNTLRGVFSASIQSCGWQRNPTAIAAIVEQCHDLHSEANKSLTQLLGRLNVAKLLLSSHLMIGPGELQEDGEEEGGEGAPAVMNEEDASDVQQVVDMCEALSSSTMGKVSAMMVVRSQLSTIALVSCQVSGQRKKIVAAGHNFENASLEYLSFVCHVGEVVDALKHTASVLHSTPSSEFLSSVEEMHVVGPQVIRGVSDTLHDLHGALSMYFSRMKDRACQASIGTSAGTTGSLQVDRMSPIGTGLFAKAERSESPSLSRPPRSRGKRPWESRGPERIDSLVQQSLIAGVKVPPNFGRVKGSTPSSSQLNEGGGGAVAANHSSVGVSQRNLFLFGTRRIELTAVDDNTLCVPVGGGFLLFSEYCRLHSDFETAKWGKQEKRAAGVGSARSSSPAR